MPQVDNNSFTVLGVTNGILNKFYSCLAIVQFMVSLLHKYHLLNIIIPFTVDCIGLGTILNMGIYFSTSDAKASDIAFHILV